MVDDTTMDKREIHKGTTSAEYVELGGQRIRVDKCPECGHTGHAPEPCPAWAGKLTLGENTIKNLVKCRCGAIQ